MTGYASCCLLSYNRPRFLATAVETLLANAGAPLELIIHDDGSPDPECRALIADWVEEGKVSTAILNPPGHNQGQGTALNRMFRIATGDPLIKIDHDLIFEPDWLADVNRIFADNRAAAEARTEPLIGLLSGFRYWHDPCDWRKTFVAAYPGWDEHEYIMGSFMAIPRAAWERLGPFEEHSDAFAEDNTMQHKVTNSGVWVCGTPQDDLMENQGYGVGPSTVVTAFGAEGATVQTIHKGPVVLAGGGEAA